MQLIVYALAVVGALALICAAVLVAILCLCQIPRYEETEI